MDAAAAAACESERKGEDKRPEERREVKGSFLDSIALKSSLGGDLVLLRNEGAAVPDAA
jgi:hypothetical protein